MRTEMEKILLITARAHIKKGTFAYAIRLCKETNTELIVLLTGGSGEALSLNRRMKTQIAFLQKQGIPAETLISAGRPDEEIPRFVQSRRNILLAIYERGILWRFQRKMEKRLARRITIPIVMVQDGSLPGKIEKVRKVLTEERKMNEIFKKIGGILKRGSRDEKNTEIFAGPAEAVSEEPGLLVVVGNESIFPDSVIEYGLEMAERMSYQIIALNTAPLSCNTFRIFKNPGDQICNDFRRISKESAAPFQARAAEKRIAFHHVIKFVETDQALEEIQKEYGEINFIVSEPEHRQADIRARNENENRVSAGICVYSMR